MVEMTPGILIGFNSQPRPLNIANCKQSIHRPDPLNQPVGVSVQPVEIFDEKLILYPLATRFNLYIR